MKSKQQRREEAAARMVEHNKLSTLEKLAKAQGKRERTRLAAKLEKAAA